MGIRLLNQIDTKHRTPGAGSCRASRRSPAKLGRCRERQEIHMLVRRCFSGLSLVGLALIVVGCGNPQGLDSIQVTPSTQTLAVGQTTQFTATGIYGNAS